MKPSYLKNSSDCFSLDDLYLSIVIPIHNEEENAAILYNEIRDSVDDKKMPYEIIFIDDGSSDRSIDILQDIKGTNSRNRIAWLKPGLLNFLAILDKLQQCKQDLIWLEEMQSFR